MSRNKSHSSCFKHLPPVGVFAFAVPSAWNAFPHVSMWLTPTRCSRSPHLSSQPPFLSCSPLSVTLTAVSHCSLLFFDFFAHCCDSSACNGTWQTVGARGIFAGRMNHFYGFKSKTDTERHLYLQLHPTPESRSVHLDAYLTPRFGCSISISNVGSLFLTHAL